MKTVLIIGLGRFGRRLATRMAELGNEVMIVDQNAEIVEKLLPYVTDGKIGDCTDEEVLRSLGVNNFDICFVCTGNSFQSSLEITDQLKTLGAKRVISKADRDIQAKFLLKNGADEVVYPNRDIADKVAVRCSMNNVFDYVELSQGYSIYEIPPLTKWIGKSIKDLDIRQRYKISVISTKEEGSLNMLPGPDHIISGSEHLVVIGLQKDIDHILEQLR
ncbi:trk system potassium uptake protein TrkA [Faecalicoccus acidiformans]|uniref:Trk system potassium uptake protein TrkA n=1 Tax=Faecalicoccus acidiformans TaxID=915173 RepID=A0A7W8D2X5_9FIRM|nr:TrkA family potassium uptake protein [Faecalicoccus acidiformans]MBB5184968.1 trk system potassium uptake protein TrkA [Faecalicoccus acidiformans]MBM6831808.1 TrkA family potassium uptake protein [Faecalicoccus acidiformans]MDM8203486.1 TrkA family potassium uptake protein [Faecalicoccus acidiformans]HIW18064.1 TrkA family potassium uptake protein [Candidatus Faecalicoccus intestinipullorum]